MAKLSIYLLASVLSICQIAAYPIEKTIETKLDHMAAGGETPTFSMRYIVDDQYYKDPMNVNKSRPILFYTGNEGDVWGFYKNTGFVTTTLAEEMGGLVVFSEHRYFGESFPFEKEYAFNEGNNTYLTVENTMMDYVELVKQIKTDYGAEDKAVIAFGGSYGGMLSAWIRMKYPQTFQGALAASAPLLYFKGAPTANENGFSDICTDDFAEALDTTRCAVGIKQGFEFLMDFKDKEDTWPELDKLFNTCAAIDGAGAIQNLYEHLQNGFLYMAMTDYPYPSDFLNPQPAWPVNASCEAFENITIQNVTQARKDGVDPLTEYQREILTAVKAASDVYFNYTGQTNCTNYNDTDATGNLDGAGWNVLACNQLAMPTAMGPNSMFIEEPFDYDAYTKNCQDTYGLTPDYDWALKTFGGGNPTYNYTKDYLSYSNIIFSNGELDPWRAGGVNNYTSVDLPVYLIRGGAHHLDLRLPNATTDTNTTDVYWVREQEKMLIQQWVEEYQNSGSQMSNGVYDLKNKFIQ